MNIESLLAGGDDTPAIRAERATIAVKIDDLTQGIGMLADAAMSAAGGLPQALLNRMHGMEAEITRLNQRSEEIDAELARTKNTGRPALTAEWSVLKSGVLALDYDARMKCRRLVADTFAAVQIYFRGIHDTPTGCMDVLLVSKTDVARWLRLDRKTGALLHGLNFDKHSS